MAHDTRPPADDPRKITQQHMRALRGELNGWIEDRDQILRDLAAVLEEHPNIPYTQGDVQAIRDGAAELEAEVRDRYGADRYDGGVHPAMKRKFERDLESVVLLRDLAARLESFLSRSDTEVGNG